MLERCSATVLIISAFWSSSKASPLAVGETEVMVSLPLAALVASATAMDGSGSVSYGLMRKISTPGFSHKTARNPSELKQLTAETQAWMGQWLDWSDAEHLALRNMRPITAFDGVRAAHGLEGAASFKDDSSRGFIFLFNPSARHVCEKVTLNEGAGMPRTSSDATFLAHEIHPREEMDGLQTPVGVWKHGDTVEVCVAPQSARVIRATKLSESGAGSLAAKLPLALNLTYASATQSVFPSGQKELKLVRVDVLGAVGPAGAIAAAVVLAGNVTTKSMPMLRLQDVYINEHISDTMGDIRACLPYMDKTHKDAGYGCKVAVFKFADDAAVRALGPAAVNSTTSELDGRITPLAAGNLTRCAEATVGAGGPPMPPTGSKNVLYLVMDDLRPEIHGPYNQSKMFTPNIDKFAAGATTFSNAYTNIAVCSPSRVSFLSGRRPTTTHVYNFVNHFRQAHCPASQGGVRWTAAAGVQYRNISIKKQQGGAGECCSQCTDDPECHAWSFEAPDLLKMELDETGRETVIEPEVGADATTLGGKFFQDYCALYGAGYGKTREAASVQTVSGEKGAYLKLTALPEHFRKSGYLALQSGKIYHTEEGSLTGSGMPPYQDVAYESWTDGCAMADVNHIANMWGCDKTPNTQVQSHPNLPTSRPLPWPSLTFDGPLMPEYPGVPHRRRRGGRRARGLGPAVRPSRRG